MEFKKNRKWYFLSSLILSSLLVTTTGCRQQKNITNASTSTPTETTSSNTLTEPLERTEFVLGTIASISLYDNGSQETLNQAFNRIQELENTLSVNQPDTLLERINENAGIKSVSVDQDTYYLIEKALNYTEITDGAFEVTIGPLVNLWHIGFSDAKVPTDEEIQKVLPLINHHFLNLNSTDSSVFLSTQGMRLDLGGLAKGYAADEVAKILRDAGVGKALINLGGNVLAIGEKPNGSPWKIGIQNPFNPRGETIGYIPIINQSVVTSGIYERYLEQDGIRYHHILNPTTGYPYANELASVTIISDLSLDGDALSTAAFAKGLKDGFHYIDSLSEIEGIFVTIDSKVYLTSGITNEFVLTNNDFIIEALETSE